jgi:hypothetical protein
MSPGLVGAVVEAEAGLGEVIPLDKCIMHTPQFSEVKKTATAWQKA